MREDILEDNYDIEYLNSIKNGNLKKGITIGCELDDYLVYKQPSVGIIMGRNNVGKTFWQDWYFLNLTKKGIKFLIFSSENRIGDMKCDMMEFYLGKELSKASDEEFQDALTCIATYFKFVNIDRTYSYYQLQELFEKNLDLFDCCVIDPYNSLSKDPRMSSNKNSHEYDYEVLSYARIFCKKNNKALVITAHASTDSLRRVYPKGHPLEGYPQTPLESDIEGGGKYGNRVDWFAIVDRQKSHPNRWMITEVHITKMKTTKTGGGCTMKESPVEFRLKNSRQFFVKETKNSNTEIDILTGKVDSPQQLTPNENFDDSPF